MLVAVGGNVRHPQFIERALLPLLPPGVFAPYHAAEGLPPAEARASVKRDVDAAYRMAREGVGAAAQRSSKAGHAVRSCGVLVGQGMPHWSTEEILAVHVRMHQAEGELFRSVLVTAAQHHGLPLATLPQKTALASAARALRITPARLKAVLAELGRQAGPPWTAHEKEAAAAALVALTSGRAGTRG